MNRNRIVVFALATTLLTTFARDARAQGESLDQEQASHPSGPYFTHQWQSFTAGIDGALTRIELFGRLQSATSLSIYEGEGTSGRLLTRQIVPEQPSIRWFSIVLSDIVSVYAGTRYTMVFNAFDAPASLWWDYSNPYDRGRHSYNVIPDLAFRTYVGDTQRCFRATLDDPIMGGVSPFGGFVDQEQPKHPSGPYFTDQWQSFTAGKDGELLGLALFGRIRSPTTMYMYKGEGTSGTLLHQQTVAVQPTIKWFPIPVEGRHIFLDACRQYTVRFSTSGTSNSLWWDSVNPYPLGMHWPSSGWHPDLAFQTLIRDPNAKTLVVFLTRLPESDVSNIQGVKNALEAELVSQVRRLSFGKVSLAVDYAGPYVGEIDQCDSSTNTSRAIIQHGIEQAHRGGVDVASYDNFVVLRNVDFNGDDCFNSGTGSYGTWSYSGGSIEAGGGTIAYPIDFGAPSPAINGSPRRTTHEFLHGYARGTSHSYVFECTHEKPQTYDYFDGVDTYCARGLATLFDVMGSGRVGWNTSMLTKRHFGWLAPKNIMIVDSSAKGIVLHAADADESSAGMQMVIVPIPGTTEAYVLEHRMNACTGAGLYVYFTRNIEHPFYEEQYLLYAGNTIVNPCSMTGGFVHPGPVPADGSPVPFDFRRLWTISITSSDIGSTVFDLDM